MSLFDHIKQLYCNQLYTNLVQLFNLILPQMEANQDLFSPANEYQVLLYYGDSLYRTKDYRRAERIYHKALSLRKNVPKNKRRSQSNGNNELTSEDDVKFQLHLCYHKMQQYSNAAMVLETIPVKNRNSKINMALGEMYKMDKNPSSINCFKEVLKESPFAIKAIINLIKLDVKVNDILNIVSQHISNIPCLSWLNNWIRAQACMYSSQTSQAVTYLKAINEKPECKDNIEVLISLGEALYYNGDYKKAIPYFKRAYASDPVNLRGMDVYAACLAKENQIKELETLSNHLIQRCESYETAHEPWVVLAYYCFLSNKKESKALFFAQKACLLSNNCVESLLLKGTVMAEAKNQEAKGYFQEAYACAPYRFEVIKCLTEAYLAEKHKSAAANTATLAMKSLGQTPRTLTLYASVLLSEPVNNEKKNAKQALERAIKIDPSFLSAVYLLSNLYMEEKNYDKAIDILLKAIECSDNNVKLHKILSECYTEKNEPEKALYHRNIASKLEVNYINASESSQRLEHQAMPTLELEVDDIPPSDDDVDESETDVVWSDDNYSVT